MTAVNQGLGFFMSEMGRLLRHLPLPGRGKLWSPVSSPVISQGKMLLTEPWPRAQGPGGTVPEESLPPIIVPLAILPPSPPTASVPFSPFKQKTL